MLANVLGIFDGQVRRRFAVGPEEAIVSGSRQAGKFLANKIQDLRYVERG
jgi:hypothetical protein